MFKIDNPMIHNKMVTRKLKWSQKMYVHNLKYECVYKPYFCKYLMIDKYLLNLTVNLKPKKKNNFSPFVILNPQCKFFNACHYFHYSSNHIVLTVPLDFPEFTVYIV